MDTKKITFIVAILLLMFSTAFGYWFVYSNKHVTLAHSLSEQQRNELSSYLDSAGVAYQTTENGEILIDEELVAEVRMAIAEKGIIQLDRVGFEIFTDADYGMTDFAQKVNYQRALQGELEKSILTIDGVRQARVHIILPKKGTLFSQQKEASASVLVHMEPSKTLSKDSINGIRFLVANAVEQLTLENVSVVDERGNVLSNTDDYAVYSNVDEQLLELEVVKLLSKWFPPEAFEVSVFVESNRDQRERRIETISPDGKKYLISQKEINARNDRSKSVGAKTIENEYTYSKEVETIKYAKYAIQRVRCAIAFSIALTDEQKTDIIKLISSAIGIDVSRGDTIEVVGALTGATQNSKETMQRSSVDNLSVNQNKNSNQTLSNNVTNNSELSNQTTSSFVDLSESEVFMALVISNLFLLALFSVSYFIRARRWRLESKQRALSQEKLIEWLQQS
jgi:flagellar M-ring protein FliF